MGRLIRASEVGEYVYCHRAWWLRHVEGRVPERRERLHAGALRHTEHGLRVRLAGRLLAAGLFVLVLSIVALLLGA